MDWFSKFPIEPVQFIYGAIALCGGVARYLNMYMQQGIFSWSMFCASAFVSGFSGYMFALMGQSLSMPEPMTYMMAGLGGFFGDATLKFLYEVVKKRVN